MSMNQQDSFEGRAALVTGAGRGFGREIALALAAKGTRVIALDVDRSAAEAVASEIDGIPLVADVGSYDDVRQACERVVHELGGIDILVNNAGIVSTTRFDELTIEEWNRVLNINLSGMFATAKACADGMRVRGGGRIVNISSIAGKRGGGFLGTIAYATSKAGVIGFTKALARELASDNITVNSVAPGAMDTEMTKDLRDNPVLLEKVLATIPLGRRGEARHVTDAVLFLASDKAEYITGETINVDGGVMME